MKKKNRPERKRSPSESSDAIPTGSFGVMMQGFLKVKFGEQLHLKTPADLAAESPFSRSTWQGWLEGTTLPRAGHNRRQLCDFLGIEPSLLDHAISGAKRFATPDCLTTVR